MTDGEGAPATLQVQGERERVGGELDWAVRQFRARHPLPVARERPAPTTSMLAAITPARIELAAGEDQPLRAPDPARVACADLRDQEQPEHAQDRARVVREDRHRDVRAGREPWIR